ncbi:restriction endonuclease subunit S [Shewanella sp. ZOR0012]|uniref:restriction endonuclease subunit S n=1 Tax=Shewanella sp. ZOR0012 TaxID=1339231 RepID=UPI000648F8AC|nr:restriction endonuclease subunit S [Shewanella sp. ZOR0012]NSM25533.1 restriction endonuclease subunit S [Shewanella sp. ZOR0012]
MDAQQFLTEFGHIANAPNGIVKLRELVLQLAISGRLVEENESSQPVEDTIKEANDIREAYEEALKLRSTRMQPPLSKIPYIIPEHWKWERLERLCKYIQRGKGPKYVDKSSTYVVSQKCVQWSGFDLTPARHIADDSLEKYGKERFLCDGDLLWNSTGTGTAGRVAIYSTTEQKSAVADSHVTVIRLANCLPRYFWCVIASPWVQLRIEPSHSDSLVSGTTQQVELNTTTVRSLPIPLPPLEEQSRIVAKVDELMALCDQLEAQQQKLRTLQNHLRQATLQAVAASQSPHELQDNWQRLQDNFEQLFSAPEDVEDVRRLAMELAVRGLLTEQRDTDESANHILLRCAEEYKDLVRNGEIKRRKPLPEIDASQAPFELPKGWVWARFPELGIFGRGKSKHRPRNDPKLFSPGIYPLVQTGEVARAGNLISEYHSKYSEVGLAQSKLWPEGTLCITIAANIADSAILGFEACFPDSVVGFLPAKELRDKVEYFLLFMKTAREQLLAFAPSTAQKNINLQILESVLVPVPPKDEIARILSRMGEINALCDRAVSARTKSLSVGELLAQASVSTLTGIAIEQEEEPMKAPQTELVAPVRLGTPPDVKAQAPLATILARHNGEMSAKDLWQRFGGEIDAFYAQLKTEVTHGWLLEPAPAEMREKADN